MKIKIKLGPARRMYLERLLEQGLAGNNLQEVADGVFNRGLQECVPAEWMHEATRRAEARARRRKEKKR